MESAKSEAADLTKKTPLQQDAVFDDNDDDDDDMDFVCSDVREEGEEEATQSRRGRKKERKVALSEEEAERKRVLANSQERDRMNRLNRALSNLRKALPAEFSVSSRRLSKIRTLRLAVSYIKGLSNLLAEDNVMRSERYHPQFMQYHHPCYPSGYPLPPEHLQSPEMVTGRPFVAGDRSGADDGYFSFHNESSQTHASFLGASCSSTPSFPYPYHPSLSPLDEGLGMSGFVPPAVNNSVVSPSGPAWISPSPALGHDLHAPGDRHVPDRVVNTMQTDRCDGEGETDRRGNMRSLWDGECSMGGSVSMGELSTDTVSHHAHHASPAMNFLTPLSPACVYSPANFSTPSSQGFLSPPVNFSTPVLQASHQQEYVSPLPVHFSTPVGEYSQHGLWSSPSCAQHDPTAP